MTTYKMKTPYNIDDFQLTIEEIIDRYSGKIRAVAISCLGKIDAKTGTVYLEDRCCFWIIYRLSILLEVSLIYLVQFIMMERLQQ
ncbi:hypothetical protein [Virgibacillus pantothenticus]